MYSSGVLLNEKEKHKVTKSREIGQYILPEMMINCYQTIKM